MTRGNRIRLRGRPSFMNTTPLLVTAALIVVVAACGGEDDADSSASDPSALAGSSWVGREIFVSGAAVGVLADTPPRLEFGADGALAGTTGCNSLFGTVRLTADAIAVDGLGMTEMGCPEPLASQEARVSAILQNADRWSLADDVLTIGAADGSGAIELVPPEPAVPPGLASTTWVLDTVVEGDAASTPVRGTRVTLVVDPGAGGISGSTGCNDYGGEATIAPPEITVGSLNVTERACEPDVMAQERLVLSVLEGATAIEVEGDTLTVRKPDDAALVFSAS